VVVGGWRETHCFCHWSDGRRQLLRNGDQRLSRANDAVPHVGPHRGWWCGLDATGPPAATASAEGGHVARARPAAAPATLVIGLHLVVDCPLDAITSARRVPIGLSRKERLTCCKTDSGGASG